MSIAALLVVILTTEQGSSIEIQEVPWIICERIAKEVMEMEGEMTYIDAKCVGT